MRAASFIARLTVIAALTVATACSAGHGSALPAAPAGPAVVSSASFEATLTTGAPTTVTLPAVGGLVATLVFGPLAAGQAESPLIVTATTAPSAGAIALTSQTLASAGDGVDTPAVTPVLYLALTAGTPLEIDDIASIALTLPSGAAGVATYNVASYSTGPSFTGSDDMGPWTTIAGPVAGSGGYVAFGATTSSLLLQPDNPFYLAIYTP